MGRRGERRRWGFSIQPWIPASPSRVPVLPLPAPNRHGSAAVTRRGTDVTLIPRPTSLSFGSLDLEAWASPLRCDRLSFSAQKPYYPGGGPGATTTSAPSPAEASARSPLSPGASGDPGQVSCSQPSTVCGSPPAPPPPDFPAGPGLSDGRPALRLWPQWKPGGSVLPC
uniref:Uncharacterized protein n=1 Tax=Rangifer tarandus platyrhynchus TaxID=3082113 RepID=A0ACB0F0R2_RANTA|nr:unnamed protein product [Rangifer tarandus platyrhynchus]